MTKSGDETSFYKIELFNLLGVPVKQITPDANPYTFSVAGIEKGIYLLRVETQKGYFTTKVQIR